MPSYTYPDLISWSHSLMGWQRDLLRRLLTAGEATDRDISELADLACPTVPSVGDVSPSPVFATDDHAPTAGSELPVVHLEKISDISRVNALAEGPVLFGSDGLTVLYGATGAGKSGLARILKKACRARDSGGKVLSNVFDEPTTEPPTATITFRVDGTSRTVGWIGQELSGGLKGNRLTLNFLPFTSLTTDVPHYRSSKRTSFRTRRSWSRYSMSWLTRLYVSKRCFDVGKRHSGDHRGSWRR